MRKSVTLAAALLVIASLAVAQSFEKVPQAGQQPAANPAAATSAVGKTAVLNVQAALLGTQEGQKAIQDFQARIRPRQAELEQLRQEIDERQRRLDEGQGVMSQDAQQLLVREIQARQKRGQRLQEDLEEESQIAQADILSRISTKMRPIIDQYAKDHGLAVILPVNFSQGSSVIYVATGVDITQDIIKMYDQAHPVAQAGNTNPGTAPGN